MKFSIITVNLNNARDLEKTILSVLEQNCRDYEHLVIDGGSTDGSLDVIRKYRDHFSYWTSEKDDGIYNAMNKGVAAASGDYCIFMNSGDTFADINVLGTVSGMLEADIVCGNARLSCGQECIWTGPDQVSELFWRQRSSLCHQAVFTRTSILKERPYNEKLKIAADYESFFYETVVNRRSYKHVDVLICNYGCDGVSADHTRSDREKISVIDSFVTNGHVEEDRLVTLAKKFKTGSRRHKLACKLCEFLLS